MSRRVERLSEQIREQVAEIIGRDLKDPRIGFVTVTRVRLSGDLRWAKVYVGVLGPSPQREESLGSLRRAAGFVRRELGRRIRLRHTPELTFQYDSGLDASDRIVELLAQNPPILPEDPGEDEGS